MRILVFVASLTAFTAVATTQSSVPTNQASAWATFQSQFGADWRVAWCQATGTPEAIWGPGMRIENGAIETTDQARRHARQALDRHAVLLGRGGSQFVEEIGHKVAHVHIFVYGQRFKGLPVIGGRADIRIHDNGVLSMLGSQALPIPPDFSVRPTIKLAAARVAAYRHLRLPMPERTARGDRLVIWGDIFMKTKSPVKLAWEIDVDVPAQQKFGRAYVDAATGVVRRYQTDLHECGFANCPEHGKPTNSAAAAANANRQPVQIDVIPDPNPQASAMVVSGTVMAWTNTDLKPGAALVNVPLRGIAIGSTFTDANGKFTLPGNSANVTIRLAGRRMSSVNPVQGTPFGRTVTLSGANNVIQIYTSGAAQFDRSQTTAYYFTDQANEFVRSIIGNPSQLNRIDRIRANVNTARACNATYSTSNVMNFYHAAGSCPNTAYNSVVLHEWGHGLDQEFGGINRNQGMSEGSADVMSIVYNDDPIVGHDFRGPNTFVRTGTNTKQYPPSGAVHSQGEVWMGWCWDVRNELVARLGQQQGVDHLRQLFVGVFVANPNSQPNGAREVALIDDDDGNLNNGTPNCSALIRALTKRKIPNPINGCPGIASYVNYGVGCKGSGLRDPKCHSRNANCSRGSTSGTTSKYAMVCVAGTGGATVLGVDLYTRARTGTVNGRVEIRLADASGRPLNTIARSATRTVTTQQKFWTFTFAQPLIIPQGQTFFVVYPGNTNLAIPLCSLSSPRERVPYWWQRSGSTTWSSIPTGTYWAFEVNCLGGPGAIPRLSNTGVPEIGRSFQLHLMSARPNARATLLVGVSDQNWPPFRLPLDLTPLGAPGCALGASGEALLPVTTDARGSATVRLSVPNSAGLIGFEFFNQFVVFDAPANNFGLAVSDNGKGQVGR